MTVDTDRYLCFCCSRYVFGKIRTVSEVEAALASAAQALRADVKEFVPAAAAVAAAPASNAAAATVGEDEEKSPALLELSREPSREAGGPQGRRGKAAAGSHSAHRKQKQRLEQRQPAAKGGSRPSSQKRDVTQQAAPVVVPKQSQSQPQQAQASASSASIRLIIGTGSPASPVPSPSLSQAAVEQQERARQRRREQRRELKVKRKQEAMQEKAADPGG